MGSDSAGCRAHAARVCSVVPAGLPARQALSCLAPKVLPLKADARIKTFRNDHQMLVSAGSVLRSHKEPSQVGRGGSLPNVAGGDRFGTLPIVLWSTCTKK